MKAFKQACINVADYLAGAGSLPGDADAEGQVKNTVLTKNVMETAQGGRVWRALRILSDLAVQRKITELSSQPYRVMVHDAENLAFSWKVSVANLN